MRLTLHNLTVGYHGKPLVENLNLSAATGEILCILGPNGAGKSTILKTLLRQIPPISGDAVLAGEDEKSLFEISEKETAKHIAAVLTEEVRPAYMSAFDVVAMGRYPHTGFSGMLEKVDVSVVENALEILSAKDLAEMQFGALSDGQKQRVMLARAIAQETDLLLLDEPIAHLDIRYSAELLSVLRSLAKEQKKTVILTLHDIPLAKRVADTVLCIREDHRFFYGKTDDVITEKNMETLFELNREILSEEFRDMPLV